jgi:hypothetical protein
VLALPLKLQDFQTGPVTQHIAIYRIGTPLVVVFVVVVLVVADAISMVFSMFSTLKMSTLPACDVGASTSMPLRRCQEALSLQKLGLFTTTQTNIPGMEKYERQIPSSQFYPHYHFTSCRHIFPSPGPSGD